MIGIDLVKIERIEQALQKYGDTFLEKFLLPEEITSSLKTASIAGKWAAKEAVAKALGCGISSALHFHDIMIKKNGVGAPYAQLSSKSALLFGCDMLYISISHDGEYATAIAMKPLSSLSSSTDKLQ